MDKKASRAPSGGLDGDSLLDQLVASRGIGKKSLPDDVNLLLIELTGK